MLRPRFVSILALTAGAALLAPGCAATTDSESPLEGEGEERTGAAAQPWETTGTHESASTHIWIVDRAIDILGAQLDPNAARIRALLQHPACRPRWLQGVNDADYLPAYNDGSTWKSHFYDPDSQQNYLFETNPTARTRANDLLSAAVPHINGGDYENGCYELGLALHYMTDVTQPMHAVNYTNLSLPFERHGHFETYAMSHQGDVGLAPTNIGFPSGSPDAMLVQAAVEAKSRWPGLSAALAGGDFWCQLGEGTDVLHLDHQCWAGTSELNAQLAVSLTAAQVEAARYLYAVSWMLPGLSAPARVALRAANGQYVVAEGGGGGVVNANRNDIGAWETWGLIPLGGSHYALQAWNGDLFTALYGGGGGTLADRPSVGSWETFELVNLPNGKTALRTTGNPMYVVAEGGGGGVVNANRVAAGPYETFTLLDVLAKAQPHDVCSTGVKLDRGASSRVSKICAAQPSCCDVAWDSTCVGLVPSVLAEACSAPLPSSFTATLQNASRDGSTNECLIMSGNGQDDHPSRYLWAGGDNGYCGFSSQAELLANKQAAWELESLGDDLYMITNASRDGSTKECLIMGGNGQNTYPSRHLWPGGDNGNCGLSSRAELLANKQAVWRVKRLAGNKLTIANASADGATNQCLIFSGNGQDTYPSRHLWSGGDDGACGLSYVSTALANQQSVWTLTIQSCPNGLLYYGGWAGGFCCGGTVSPDGSTCDGTICALDASQTQGFSVCDEAPLY